MSKRIKIFVTLMFICFSLLLFRLSQIQLWDTTSFGKHDINLISQSINNRTKKLTLDDGRGIITDRNGFPLNEQVKNRLVLLPGMEEKLTDASLQKVASVLYIQPLQLKKVFYEATKKNVLLVYPNEKKPYELTELQLFQIERLIQDERIPGIFPITRKEEPFNMVARQFIGVVGRDATTEVRYGKLGLQQSLNDLLKNEKPTQLLYHLDGRRNPLLGEEVKLVDGGNEFFPVTVETTLDYSLQTIVEHALIEELKSKEAKSYEKRVQKTREKLYTPSLDELTKKNKNMSLPPYVPKAAAVLMDIETNEVVAMASAPLFDGSLINEGAKNYATTPLTPGSIFKTVTLSAALKKLTNIETRTFNCSQTIYGTEDKRNLGQLNLRDSFATSCNNTFGTLAAEMMTQKGDEQLLVSTMQSLGLLFEENSGVTWRGNSFPNGLFPEGHNGLYVPKEWSLNAKKQIGIGQLDVKLTPLAVANMMTTIARGGEPKQVKTVRDIRYKNGLSLYHFPTTTLSHHELSTNELKTIRSYMESVVNEPNGTMYELLKGTPYKVAGKSGTAQVQDEPKDVVLTDEERNAMYHHRWFAGYFPAQSPKYALVVVQLDTHSQNSTYARIFKRIVTDIYKQEGKTPK